MDPEVRIEFMTLLPIVLVLMCAIFAVHALSELCVKMRYFVFMTCNIVNDFSLVGTVLFNSAISAICKYVEG